MCITKFCCASVQAPWFQTDRPCCELVWRQCHRHHRHSNTLGAWFQNEGRALGSNLQSLFAVFLSQTCERCVLIVAESQPRPGQCVHACVSATSTATVAVHECRKLYIACAGVLAKLRRHVVVHISWRSRVLGQRSAKPRCKSKILWCNISSTQQGKDVASGWSRIPMSDVDRLFDVLSLVVGAARCSVAVMSMRVSLTPFCDGGRFVARECHWCIALVDYDTQKTLGISDSGRSCSCRDTAMTSRRWQKIMIITKRGVILYS